MSAISGFSKSKLVNKRIDKAERAMDVYPDIGVEKNSIANAGYELLKILFQEPRRLEI